MLATFTICALLSIPMTPEEKAKIENYWLHINELQAMENAKPPEEPQDVSAGFALHRTFPFEAYDHLTGKDLIRAAKEGIKAVSEELIAPSDEASVRAAVQNVQFALEYYPVVATEQDALALLVDLLAHPSEPYPMRLFLMRQLGPTPDPPSAFGLYFREHLYADHEATRRLLGDRILDPLELSPIKILAMETLYHVALSEYLELFHADANVKKRAEETGQELMPILLRDDPAFKLTARTQQLMKEPTLSFVAMAQLFARNLEPLNKQDEPTQQKARELIERIAAEIPVENPGEIRALVEVPPAKPQS